MSNFHLTQFFGAPEQNSMSIIVQMWMNGKYHDASVITRKLWKRKTTFRLKI